MIPLLLVTSEKEAIKKFLQKRVGIEKSINITLEPIQSEYSINQIREIQKEAHIHQPMRRTYIFEGFDNASLEAQNACLKLLEEPPDAVEFILVVSNTYTVLPTIISRTKIVRLDKEKTSRINTLISKALQSIVSMKTFASLDFSLFTCQSKEEAIEVTQQICLFFHSRLCEDVYAPSILREALKVNGLIKNNNLNHQLAIDHLLIFIAKKYSMKV